MGVSWVAKPAPELTVLTWARQWSKILLITAFIKSYTHSSPGKARNAGARG
jgi:hypothetical protein